MVIKNLGSQLLSHILIPVPSVVKKLSQRPTRSTLISAESLLKVERICTPGSNRGNESLRQQSSNLSIEPILEPRIRGRGSIGRLSRNETDYCSFNSDVVNTSTPKDDDSGRVNDEVGRGAYNYGNSAEIYSSIENVFQG